MSVLMTHMIPKSACGVQPNSVKCQKCGTGMTTKATGVQSSTFCYGITKNG